MQPETQRRAYGLIVMLTSPLNRLVGRIDIGMIDEEGLRIWGYEDQEFWLCYKEESDDSLTIAAFWER